MSAYTNFMKTHLGGMKGKSKTERQAIFKRAVAAWNGRKRGGSSTQPKRSGGGRGRKLSRKARAAALKNLAKARRSRGMPHGARRGSRRRSSRSTGGLGLGFHGPRGFGLVLEVPAVTSVRTRFGGQRFGSAVTGVRPPDLNGHTIFGDPFLPRVVDGQVENPNQLERPLTRN